MKKIKQRPKLSSQYIIKILQVFENNKWEIEGTQEDQDSLFNRFCERLLAVGENKRRDLMIELTERYLWLQENDYLDHLIIALTNLLKMNLDINEKTKVYVMQLISPEDEGSTKSAAMLVYLFNSVRLRHHSHLSKYKFEIVDDKSKVQSYLLEDNSILILADDYIGTGEKAEKCILNLMDNGINLNQISIVSLVTQQKGLEYLKKYKLCVASSIVRERGISDYYESDVLESKLELMRQIEDRMSVKNKYKFGYGSTEALVTMCRTPNNTFPLFWEESGNMKYAPFPRF